MDPPVLVTWFHSEGEDEVTAQALDCDLVRADRLLLTRGLAVTATSAAAGRG